jgi:hypothetical protein
MLISCTSFNCAHLKVDTTDGKILILFSQPRNQDHGDVMILVNDIH